MILSSNFQIYMGSCHQQREVCSINYDACSASEVIHVKSAFLIQGVTLIYIKLA